MKTIRKELKCTQSGMADILKVGFRTYVRYEAGERDAPVSVMVKMSRLGNLSLDQLLTQGIEKSNILPIETETLNLAPPEVKSANFKTGKIQFKKSGKEGLLAMDDSEKEVLALYRKLPASQQDAFVKGLGRTYKATKASAKPLISASRLKTPAEVKAEEKKAAAAKEEPKKKRPKRKGKPGRRKVDKKALREKVDRLKKITKTINKITVR